MPAPREWTPEEDEIFRHYYGNVPVRQLARRFKCRWDLIDKHALQIGLPLRSNYGKHRYNVIRGIDHHAEHVKVSTPPPPPVRRYTASDFIKPPTRAQLMAGR